MAGASISHVLIVAGPSGAGKSAFLKELAAGRLPQEIARHLPDNSHNWPEVYSNKKADWRPLLTRGDGGAPLSGLAVHYDITLMWMALDRALERDPFWDILEACEAATVVNIRPTRERLQQQWIRAHLRTRWPWAAHYKAVWTEFIATTLTRLRPWIAGLSGPGPDPSSATWQNRLLKAWDFHVLVRRHAVKVFPFYRGDGTNVEQMMQAWDRVTATLLAGVPTTHIELAPDRSSKIAKRLRWRVVAVSPQGGRRAVPARAALSQHPTIMALVTAAANLC